MISTDAIVKPYLTDLNDIDWEQYKAPNGSPSVGYSPDIYLFQKWAYKVEKKWYGFDLGNVPMLWAIIINEFLFELDKVAPNFHIHQIKLKWGGLRFYVDLCLNEASDPDLIKAINDEIGKLETRLYSEKLIY